MIHHRVDFLNLDQLHGILKMKSRKKIVEKFLVRLEMELVSFASVVVPVAMQ